MVGLSFVSLLTLLVLCFILTSTYSFGTYTCTRTLSNRMPLSVRRRSGFQLSSYSNNPATQEDVDYNSLEPDSPFFLDMPWPTEIGPLSSAFARHMQWKRKLSDGERLRWQRWAVYQRMKVTNKFQYSLEDYITQNMQQELGERAAKHLYNNDSVSASMYSATAMGLKTAEAQEVRAVMTAYYSAFNRQNFDELRALWLPDENSELIFPGFEKVRGDQAVEKLYHKLIAESAPMGTVKATISGIQCYGNVAMVHTVEEVQAGSALKAGGKKRGEALLSGSNEPKRGSRPRRVLATTILRKAHKQWRILSHHAVRMWSSPFTGDSVDVSFTRRDARLRAELMREIDREARAQTATEAEGTLELAMDEVERLLQSTSSNALASSMDVRKMGEGSLRPVLRQRPDGTFERVVTLDHAPAPAPTAVATTVSESSIINTSSVSKEEATQAADIVVPKVGAEKNGISVEKSVSGASSLRSLNNSNSAASSGGAGDFELLDVDTGIDENAAISKQAVQAIRRLHKEGRLNTEERALLISDVISNLAQEKSSLVEVAYEMLYAYPVHEEENLMDEKEHLSNFADQCHVILRSLG